MYCLLCHEKIPRLRAWRTKSEFCSDECASQYKRQTLDRLLTDQDGDAGGVPLPLDEPSPEDIDVSVEPDLPEAHDPPTLEGAGGSFADIFDEHDEAAAPPLGEAQSAQEAPAEPAAEDDIWRMAGGVGMPAHDGLGDLPDLGGGSVDGQSAEDALAALRELAAGAKTPPPTEREQPRIDGIDPFDDLPPELFHANEPSASRELDDEPALDRSSLEQLSAGELDGLHADDPVPEPSSDADDLPPEPDFNPDIAMLDERELELAARTDAESHVETSSDEQADPERLPDEPDDFSILDRLVAESDWNTESQARADQPDQEVETSLPALDDSLPDPADLLAEGDPFAEADLPDGDPFADLEEEGSEASEANLAPRDDEFVESMLAAVEQLDDSENTTVKVVPFPSANGAKKSDARVDEPPDEQPDEQAAAASEDEPTSESEAPAEKKKPSRARRSARKAPKLRPAMILAGIYPTPSGADEPEAAAWRELVDDASSSQPGAFALGAPLLNGLGARPLASDRRLEAHQRIDGLLPEARWGDLAGGLKIPRPALEPVAPAVAMVWSTAAAATPFEAGVLPSFIDGDLVGGPAAAQAPPESNSPAPASAATSLAGPLEPSADFYEAVSELPLESPEEDGDWFTDIEGFESL